MYKIIKNLDDVNVIVKTDENNVVSMFFEDESNPDYRQYLVDTDGGLPLPKETKEDK
jgi:hypothetical protein